MEEQLELFGEHFVNFDDSILVPVIFRAGTTLIIYDLSGDFEARFDVIDGELVEF